MTTSPNLAFSYLQPNQAQKHVTLNEALIRLDALVQLVVQATTQMAQPVSPADGERWIVSAGATGEAWAAFNAGAIAAYQDGAWQEIAPGPGWQAWSLGEHALLVFDGTDWSPIETDSPEEAPLFGVNTSADSTNRLSVKADGVLISHDDVTPGSGDIRLSVNKAAAPDTASLIFQSGSSGRAEFGLAGDDTFRLKVSSDGTSWRNALTVEADSLFSIFEGHLGLDRSAPSDLWLSSGGFLSPQGMVGSNGGYGYGLWFNGYRNSSDGWTSQNIGGSNAAAGFELQRTACLIRFEDAPTGVPEIRLKIDAVEVTPGADDAMALGNASSRWSQIYAASGAISTSDKRQKQSEGKLDHAEARVARRILGLVGKYRWKSALARKGEAARMHVGIAAQDVRDAFEAEGLDAARYGIWCEDTLMAYVDDPEAGLQAAPRTETLQGLRHEELILFLLAALLA